MNHDTRLLASIPATTYADEFLPTIKDGIGQPSSWEAHHRLNDQPSDLCMMKYFCGLKNCNFEVGEKSKDRERENSRIHLPILNRCDLIN